MMGKPSRFPHQRVQGRDKLFRLQLNQYIPGSGIAVSQNAGLFCSICCFVWSTNFTQRKFYFNSSIVLSFDTTDMDTFIYMVSRSAKGVAALR